MLLVEILNVERNYPKLKECFVVLLGAVTTKHKKVLSFRIRVFP